MTKSFEPTDDTLAPASLTPEQRKAWDAMHAKLVETRHKADELERQLRNPEATNDEQPTVLTRPEFNREVARMLAFDERYGGSSSVLYLNIDHLDTVAAKAGKAVANAAIREITNLLVKTVRTSDIVGRLGPDEFGVLLVRCENAAAWKKGKELADLLFTSLQEMHGHRLHLGISYGAYTFRSEEDVATGLKEAAQAMTKATGE